MTLERSTENKPIKEWPNRQGICMDLYYFANTEFARINFGPRKRLSATGEVITEVQTWVSELKDDKWPVERPATPQETESFALAALKAAPESVLAKDLAEYAIKVLEVQSEFIQARANRIKNTLKHFSKS